MKAIDGGEIGFFGDFSVHSRVHDIPPVRNFRNGSAKVLFLNVGLRGLKVYSVEFGNTQRIASARAGSMHPQ